MVKLPENIVICGICEEHINIDKECVVWCKGVGWVCSSCDPQ